MGQSRRHRPASDSTKGLLVFPVRAGLDHSVVHGEVKCHPTSGLFSRSSAQYCTEIQNTPRTSRPDRLMTSRTRSRRLDICPPRRNAPPTLFRKRHVIAGAVLIADFLTDVGSAKGARSVDKGTPDRAVIRGVRTEAERDESAVRE
ncbi:hypothetical protein LshimejAT787_0602110 [Lyophyllum shimeji]|uniref:Uncharacterized protein n=1 Tax=Lyophyllum shimeji TaxID=47721 RepID=A0A9P3PP79_LYOSH|nr:hypothetical protein LshimejAT787_0602110 [Lyophyllum shimeji]